MIMLRVSGWTSLALLLGLSASVGAAAPPPVPVHTAIVKALPLLVKGSRGHMEERQCFACHSLGVSILALTTARSRGLTVRNEDVHDQLEYLVPYVDRDLRSAPRAEDRTSSALGAGSALAALEDGGWKADATTEALVEHLLQYSKDLDHWKPKNDRPPTQGSPFSDAYYALRGLRVWGSAAQRERIARRTSAARGWLLATKPADTEDRVFRLRALPEAGVKGNALSEAVTDLLRTQRSDGGWGQLDGSKSDAYATATALVALHHAGGLATTDKAYQRGIAWLRKAQLLDGSWLVHTRSKPIQKYYESGFPHGKDQFISMAATGWAVTALALTLPEPAARTMSKR
jgi:hypothetical protein